MNRDDKCVGVAAQYMHRYPFVSMGIFRVLQMLNEGLLFVAITGLTALRFVENVKFQRSVEHTGLPPLWAGCHLKWC